MVSSCSPVTIGAAFISSAIFNCVVVVDVLLVYGVTGAKAEAE